MRHSYENYSIDSVLEMVNSEKLVIPAYQRKLVWSKSKQSLLIDSIYKNWMMPPIIVSKIGETYGKYEVIDGSQRIRTIVNFANNETSDNNGNNIIDIDYQQKHKFYSYPLHFIIIEGMDGNEIGEYFYRLNSHISLTDSEKRNAYQSKFRRYIDGIIEQYSEIAFNEEYLGFKNTRLVYNELLSKVAIAVDNKSLNLDYNNLVNYYYRDDLVLKNNSKKKLMMAMDEFCNSLKYSFNYNLGYSFKTSNLFSWLYVLAIYPTKYKVSIESISKFMSNFENARFSVCEDIPIKNYFSQISEFESFLLKSFNYYMSKSPMKPEAMIRRELIIRILLFKWKIYTVGAVLDTKEIDLMECEYLWDGEYDNPEIFFDRLTARYLYE